MKETLECYGGPLDGRKLGFVEVAFPYPKGWYYLQFTPDNKRMRYIWREEGFIKSDYHKVPMCLRELWNDCDLVEP